MKKIKKIQNNNYHKITKLINIEKIGKSKEMASKPLCCGLILLILIIVTALFLASAIYNRSYQRSPTVREAQENLENAVDNAKDNIKDTTIPITTQQTKLFFLPQE